MRKVIFSILFLAAGVVSYAQDFYVKPYVGYGIGYPGETGREAIGDTSQTSVTRKTVQLGGGIRGGASFGILFDDGFGLDFDLSYQNNMGQEFESESVITDYTLTGPVLREISETRIFSGYSFRFSPSIHFEFEGAGIKPFVDLGPSIVYSGFTSRLESKGPSEVLWEEKFEGNLTIGAAGNIGVEFEIADDVFLSTALRVSMVHSSPNRSEVVTYEVDGENILDEMETHEIVTEYVKEYTVDYSEPYDPDAPEQTVKERSDFSSVSLIAGVKILLD